MTDDIKPYRTPQRPLYNVWQGAKDSIPLVLAAVPFGIVYGALGNAQGLADWVVMAISVFVFAGASQFIAVTLLATGAAIPVIVLTVFIVNLRHTLYAITLIPFVNHLSAKARMLMGFSLTDETFAVVYNKVTKHAGKDGIAFYFAGSAGLMYLNWVTCTYIGIIAGNQFPWLTTFGLDIAMVVAFIGILVPLCKNYSHWFCAFIAAASALLTASWPHQTGLLFSTLAAVITGVLTHRLVGEASRSEGTSDE